MRNVSLRKHGSDISSTGDVLDAWRKVPWIGISTTEEGFAFKWTDRTPVDYTDFHPSLNITSAQNCGLLVTDQLTDSGTDYGNMLFKWWAGDCNLARRAFVCKKRL